jgi:diaminopropionate ammonia-lyase
MRLLASGMGDEEKIIAGESGVAGLALLTELKYNQNIKEALGLNNQSRVLLFGTEGATDQEIYDKIINQ